jgi:hypothetical protein
VGDISMAVLLKKHLINKEKRNLCTIQDPR